VPMWLGDGRSGSHQDTSTAATTPTTSTTIE
jgi:hypothetical protein